MGILDRLWRRREATAVIDPVMGPLEFNADAGVWRGLFMFAGREVDLVLLAGREGPSEDERVLFAEIVADMATLEEKGRVAIVPEIQEWLPAESDVSRVICDGVSLWPKGTREGSFALCFLHPDDPDGLYKVRFAG